MERHRPQSDGDRAVQEALARMDAQIEAPDPDEITKNHKIAELEADVRRARLESGHEITVNIQTPAQTAVAATSHRHSEAPSQRVEISVPLLGGSIKAHGAKAIAAVFIVLALAAAWYVGRRATPPAIGPEPAPAAAPPAAPTP